jgi:hypothetical protein
MAQGGRRMIRGKWKIPVSPFRAILWLLSIVPLCEIAYCSLCVSKKGANEMWRNMEKYPWRWVGNSEWRRENAGGG